MGRGGTLREGGYSFNPGGVGNFGRAGGLVSRSRGQVVFSGTIGGVAGASAISRALPRTFPVYRSDGSDGFAINFGGSGYTSGQVIRAVRRTLS
jgi:hypothetical protein